MSNYFYCTLLIANRAIKPSIGGTVLMPNGFLLFNHPNPSYLLSHVCNLNAKMSKTTTITYN